MISLFRLVALVSTFMLLAFSTSSKAEQLVLLSQSPMQASNPGIPIADIAGQLWRKQLDELNAQGRAYALMYNVFEVEGRHYIVSAIKGPDCTKNACSWRVARLTPDNHISAMSGEIEACGERNRLSLTKGKLMICGVAVPLPVNAVKEPPLTVKLSGRYAFYLASTAEKTDRGPQSDADCHAFIASDLYDPDGGEHLTIRGNRWDDWQDVSAVTGDVVLHEAKGNSIPFTIDVESEGDNGPTKGSVTRVGRLGLSIAFAKKRAFHYCKVGW